MNYYNTHTALTILEETRFTTGSAKIVFFIILNLSIYQWRQLVSSQKQIKNIYDFSAGVSIYLADFNPIAMQLECSFHLFWFIYENIHANLSSELVHIFFF